MFIPETIDLGQSEKYDLSIRIKSDGFMFSIFEPNAGNNYCLRETEFSESSLLNNVQRIVFDLNFLTQQFRSTNVIIASPDYELVPIPYYEEKKKEILYNFSHNKKANNILCGCIENQNCVTLYNLDAELYDFLSRSLYNPSFYHHTNILIDLLTNKKKVINLTSRMYINFHHDMLDVICFSNTELLHCLTYKGESPENQLYFILKLWEKSGFDQITDWLYIINEPPRETMLGFQKFIKNIETANFPTEAFLWNEDAQKAPLDLLALSL